MPVSTMGELGLRKRHGMKEGHSCLVTLSEGSILPSHGSLEQWVRTGFPLSPQARGQLSLLYQAGRPEWRAVPQG